MSIGLLYIITTGLTSSYSIEAVKEVVDISQSQSLTEYVQPYVENYEQSCAKNSINLKTTEELFESVFLQETILKFKNVKNFNFLNKSFFLDSEIAKILKEVKRDIQPVSLDLRSLKRTSPEVEDFISNKSGMVTKSDLNRLSKFYSLPEDLLYSVMMKESEGNKNALSHKKARGLFQFISQTAKDFGLIVEKNGREIDLRANEWKSADAAARYLSWIFTYLHPEKDRSDPDNYNYVLAGYNAGIGVVKRGSTLRVPNYKETKDYVKYVIGHTKGDYYKVQKGDVFRKIASKYEMDSITLTRLNSGVNQKTLKAGSYLLINKKIEKNNYIVKKGDSLYGIAKRHKISVEDIVIANALPDNLIKIGQELSMPF